EYERLKKEYEEKNPSTDKNKKNNFNKLKRDIHQSDYIDTVESFAVKSKYELYNIVSSRITMLYRPYNNFIFSIN
uniref:hypothetical protein n=1 Tax=Streptobacillus moniliformis TaxID=34105 RepID=UPI001E34EAB3